MTVEWYLSHEREVFNDGYTIKCTFAYEMRSYRWWVLRGTYCKRFVFGVERNGNLLAAWKKKSALPFCFELIRYSKSMGLAKKKQILPSAYWSIESRGTPAIKRRMRQCINIYNIENETAIITIYQTFPITVTYCCCSALHPLHLIPSFTFGVFSSVEIVSSGSSSHHFYFDSKILLRFLFSRRDIV